MLVYREMELVRQVLDEATLATRYHRAGWAPDPAGIIPWLACQPRTTGDSDMIAELLAREGDPSLEEAIVHTIPRLEALTQTAGPTKGLCPAYFTGSYPILVPDTAVADARPSATAQPSTLPLPNP